MKIFSNQFFFFIFIFSKYIFLVYIDIEISYLKKKDWIDIQVLLNYDDQSNFVNKQFSKENLIPRVLKSILITLILVNNKCFDKNLIIHFNLIILKIKENEESINLNIITITHDIILDKSWLNKHDSIIQWTSFILIFDFLYYQKYYSHYDQTISFHI